MADLAVTPEGLKRLHELLGQHLHTSIEQAIRIEQMTHLMAQLQAAYGPESAGHETTGSLTLDRNGETVPPAEPTLISPKRRKGG